MEQNVTLLLLSVVRTEESQMSSESMVNVRLEALGWVDPGTLDARYPPKPLYLCNWPGERKYKERFMS